MRQIFYIMFIASLASCASLKTNTQYINKKGAYGVGSLYEFYGDGRFHYSWVEGLAWGNTYGTWERKKKKLILNSDMQPRDLLSTVYASENSTNDSIVFSISFADRNYVSSVQFIFYKNGQVASGFESGWDILKQSDTINLKVKKNQVAYDSIKIGSLGLDAALYRFSNETYPDSLTCILKPLPRNYIYFTDKTFRLKTNRIIGKRNDSGKIKMVFTLKKSKP